MSKPYAVWRKEADEIERATSPLPMSAEWQQEVEAQREKDIIDTMSRLGIPEKYRIGSASLDKSHNAATYAAVRAFLALDEKKRLYLYGGTGQGKSAYLWATCAHLVRKGQYVRYMSLPRFIADVAAKFPSDREAFIEPYVSCRWLLIDECGAETVKTDDQDVAMAAFFRVYDDRYLANRKTLSAGNLSPQQLTDKSEYWRRIVSRMVENGGAIELTDGDYRRNLR